MKSMFRALWDTAKVFLLFVGCTVLFYFVFTWMDEEYENYHKYDPPSDNAVKVSNTEEGLLSEWTERLELFYEYGE